MAIVEIKIDAIESFADGQAFSEAGSYLRINRYPSEGLGQGASTTNGVIVHAADRLGHC